MPGEVLSGSSQSAGRVDGATPASTDTILLERRREARVPTNWIAVILLRDGTEIPCTVKDVSKSGARLGLPETVVLPDGFSLKVLGYTFLLRVRLVWRSGHFAGVRIERFARSMPPSPTLDVVAAEAPAEVAERYTSLGSRRRRYTQV